MLYKTKRYLSILLILLLTLGVVTGCTYTEEKIGEIEKVELSDLPPEVEEEQEPYSYFEGAEVYFVDVGQGDSTVIVTSGKEAIIIDAGEKRDGKAVLDILEKAGVEEVALLIATHPHADHIGGMSAVLDNYDVREILMSGHVTTTKVFEDILDKIDSQGKGITKAEVGQQWIIGGVAFDILGVDTIPSDNNNSSIVMRMEYGETSILFTGDLEERAEKIVAEEHGDFLKSDILSVGHHGSDTSSSELFLDYVKPSMGIISVGAGNRYNHPSKAILDRFESRGVQILRTDEVGTVKLELDGKDIILSEETKEITIEPSKTKLKKNNTRTREIALEPLEVASVIVGEEVVILDGVYHLKSCELLKGEKTETKLRIEAEDVYIKCNECIE